MSFLRHQRSFRPMGKEQTGSGLGAHSRLSSARMSRSRLFLGGSVSTGARFRFIGCGQNAVQWSCRSSNLQRTANSVLFGCLSRGVHPKTVSYSVVSAEGSTPTYWRQAIKWNKDAASEGIRKRVFCASLADWAEEAPSGLRERLWSMIKSTPNLDWLLLTKRAKNIRKYLPGDWDGGYPNVWLGVSCEDREHGYPRVDILRAVPATKRFISCEPLLEDISTIDLTGIDWVIVGGESGNGNGVREFDVEWARHIRAACTASNVSFFLKQVGTHPIEAEARFAILQSTPDGKNDRHGRFIGNFPADLQVQEVPGKKVPPPPADTVTAPSDVALGDATAQDLGRVLGWLQTYADADCGVLTHLAEAGYASITGMLSVLNDLNRVAPTKEARG